MAKKETWVYLMLNQRNGFYKIGESIKPRYREKTLQAEDPQVDLIGAWYATPADEKALHAHFADKRLRGEWFRLNHEDISVVQSYFYEAVNWNIGRSQKDIDREWLEARQLEYEKRESLAISEHWSTEDIGFSGDCIDFLQEGFGIEL